ncbi:response regulator transcription factor [Paracoccus xiamenensis]|uniref:response regulator transcription factor n=1 Tax=Paracoccus xiamenensis TaxID=2714901 RepID=UPI002E29ED1D|nr:response regulator transcription factor [Paracoccus xiamenensis]
MLLVEDAEDVAQAIATTLSRRGDAVDHAATLADARDLVAVQDYDVAILDIELPDGLGTEVLSEIRKASKPTPVLMLTARTRIDERVSALDRGADDYLVKPFDLRELEARVRALIRRGAGHSDGVIEFADLVFDPASCSLDIAGEPVSLTRREFSLLEIMLSNRGRVVSKDRILERMYSFEDEQVGTNTVELHMGRLRRKLERSRVTIRTLRGLGYQLVDQS